MASVAGVSSARLTWGLTGSDAESRDGEAEMRSGLGAGLDLVQPCPSHVSFVLTQALRM